MKYKYIRAIDANELIKTLKYLKLGEHSLIEKMFADGVYEVIEDMPILDAVPVVRCEDCEHYSGGICWHPYITGSCDCDVEKEPDGFCDWGNRKDGEAND